jgi:hypothetical protein
MCASAGAADAQPDRAAPRAADRGLRAGSPGVRPRRIGAELAMEKWGWAADLSARRLAPAGRVGAEHARQAPGLGRASPRSLRARPLTPPGFHEKDQLENAIHDRVCDDVQAPRWLQRGAANDWVALYRDLAGPADTAGIG